MDRPLPGSSGGHEEVDARFLTRRRLMIEGSGAAAAMPESLPFYDVPRRSAEQLECQQRMICALAPARW